MIRPFILFLFCTFTISIAQSKLTVIHAGRLLDTKEGQILTEKSIVIDGDKIESIENGYQIPIDAEVIDLKDHILMPGLMDMHTHLSEEFSAKIYSEKFYLNEADFTVRSVVYAKRTLMAGFTTVRDLGDRFHISSALKKGIESGMIPGPRIFTAGKAIGTTGGHADPTNGRRFNEMDFPGPDAGVVNGAKEARAAVRQRYKEGADLIKITATGGVLSTAKSGQNPQFMKDELDAIMKTARDYGFTVAAHAHGKEGMLRAIKAGVSSIEHGTFLDDEVIRAMKRYGTYYVPTITAGHWVAEKSKVDGFFPEIVRPKAALIGPKIQSSFAKAYKGGVKIAFGTDSGVSEHGKNAKEFQLMVDAGMKPMEAIQAATFEASKLLKQENELGQVAPGFYADLVAIAGDPLKDISLLEEIAFVMKGGEVVKQVP